MRPCLAALIIELATVLTRPSPLRSFIPETKGLSLEQVDLLYRNSSIIHSNSYRKKLIAENIQDETQEGYYAAAQDKNAGRAGHLEHAGKRDFDSDGLVEGEKSSV